MFGATTIKSPFAQNSVCLPGDAQKNFASNLDVMISQLVQIQPLQFDMIFLIVVLFDIYMPMMNVQFFEGQEWAKASKSMLGQLKISHSATEEFMSFEVCTLCHSDLKIVFSRGLEIPGVLTSQLLRAHDVKLVLQWPAFNVPGK